MRRREFLYGAAGLSLMSGADGAAKTWAASAPTASPHVAARARVVVARNAAVRAGEERFDAARLGRMLDGALMRLTNTQKAEAAWRALFSPKDVVGVKVNCLTGPRLSTHPVLVEQIIRGLRLAGVPGGNIYVWERFSRELARTDFQVGTWPGGVRCAGVDGHYDAAITFAGKVGGCFAPFVSSLCTAHINVPVLKDHLLAGLGVGLKNFYGAIHNPNKYHDNGCDPYVSDVNNHPWIKDRLRLVVCDALNGQYDGGPTLRPHRLWRSDSLLVARDPVALDAVAWSIIDAQRVKAGLKTLAQDGREPKWLATAHAYGLGEMDLDKIEVVHL